MLAKKLVVSIGVLGALGLPAIAEDAVKTMPGQIVVTGERCPDWACTWLPGKEEARQLVLKLPKPDEVGSKEADLAAKSVVRSIRVVPLDLDRKDSQFVFSAKQISGPAGEMKLVPGQGLLLPLKFQLKGSAASGEYSGNLLIEHDKGDLLVPVVVKLRDPWWIALGVLGLGVGLASVLSFYQADGFDRDRVRSAMAKLRARMEADGGAGVDDVAQVAKLFQAQVEVCLGKVEDCLDGKQWEEAQKELKEAKGVWSRWRKDDKVWSGLWRYGIDMGDRIGKDGTQIPEDSDYAKQVRLALDGAGKKVASYESPEKFRQELDRVHQGMQRYFDGKALLDELYDLRSSLGDQWKQEVDGLKRQLRALSPEDEGAYRLWSAEGQSLKGKMQQQGVMAQGRGDEATQLPSPPTSQSADSSGAMEDGPDDGGAGKRLWLDETVKRLAFVGFMCGLGFSQVYAGNATFGANPGADYYGLLAWGFGAEATRDSLAKVLQRKPKAGGEK
jgi:hypothetical protein